MPPSCRASLPAVWSGLPRRATIFVATNGAGATVMARARTARSRSKGAATPRAWWRSRIRSPRRRGPACWRTVATRSMRLRRSSSRSMWWSRSSRALVVAASWSSTWRSRTRPSSSSRARRRLLRRRRTCSSARPSPAPRPAGSRWAFRARSWAWITRCASGAPSRCATRCVRRSSWPKRASRSIASWPPTSTARAPPCSRRPRRSSVCRTAVRCPKAICSSSPTSPRPSA